MAEGDNEGTIQERIERRLFPVVDATSDNFLREVSLLQRLFERTESLYKPIRDTIQAVGGTRQSEDALVLSMISRPTKIDYPPGTRLDATLKPRRLPTFMVTESVSEQALTDDRAKYISDLDWAAKSRPDIVVFNELGYPEGQKGLLDGARAAFENDIQKFCDKSGSVVISGSHHDDECYNVSLIYSPGQNIIRHLKLHSALNVGERIALPESTTFSLYQYSGEIFSVLICVDAFIPSLAMRLARLNHVNNRKNLGTDRVSFVLVPAFSPQKSQMVAEACCDISILADCVVGMVNCAEAEPALSLFCGGHEWHINARKDPIVRAISDDKKSVTVELSAATIAQIRAENAKRSSGLLDMVRGPHTQRID